jgi:hypothetical protein
LAFSNYTYFASANNSVVEKEGRREKEKQRKVKEGEMV